jgi:hypothetical protein
MKLPKFLLADNSEFPEDLFVVHTEYPRFILNVEEEEVEWLDDLEGDDEETMADEATKVEAALNGVMKSWLSTTKKRKINNNLNIKKELN